MINSDYLSVGCYVLSISANMHEFSSYVWQLNFSYFVNVYFIPRAYF